MRPQRLPLVAYRSAIVVPDVADAMRALEQKAAAIGGVRIQFSGATRGDTSWDPWVPGPLGLGPHRSMRPTGREVYLSAHLTHPDEGLTPQAQEEAELELLWGMAIPLGFTPWNRYPLPGAFDNVFHFLGPWQGVLDHLAGEGRGEVAWQSVCAAAQSDVGTWKGSNRVETFVQSQLHRLGLHCGPVDGVIGPWTSSAIQALGMPGNTLEDIAQALSKFAMPKVSKEQRSQGHIILSRDDVNVLTYGKVAATRLNQGYSLTIDGPGRVVLNIGEV